MHIPDGFLSTPVWAGLGLAAAPGVAWASRRASATLDERRVPLLGVMGAFVFAAQMVNFPVGVGTSGHFVGGALLALSLGPAAAAVVMTAIVAVQALVFQDGGLLALGANVFNMALAGIAVGYLPIAWFGRRTVAIFFAGFLSVICGAGLALGELKLSGATLPAPVVGVSLALFAVSAAAEGVITVLAWHAIERLGLASAQQGASAAAPQPASDHQPSSGRALIIAGTAAVVVVLGGVLIASTAPDGLKSLAEQAGFSVRERALISTPFSGYETVWFQGKWARQATAGVLGLIFVFILSVSLARVFQRRGRTS